MWTREFWYIYRIWSVSPGLLVFSSLSHYHFTIAWEMLRKITHNNTLIFAVISWHWQAGRGCETKNTIVLKHIWKHILNSSRLKKNEFNSRQTCFTFWSLQSRNWKAKAQRPMAAHSSPATGCRGDSSRRTKHIRARHGLHLSQFLHCSLTIKETEII